MPAIDRYRSVPNARPRSIVPNRELTGKRTRKGNPYTVATITVYHPHPLSQGERMMLTTHHEGRCSAIADTVHVRFVHSPKARGVTYSESIHTKGKPRTGCPDNNRAPRASRRWGAYPSDSPKARKP